MIVKDDDAKARLGSPMNLINQLRNPTQSRKNAMSLFIPSGGQKQEKKPAKQEEEEVEVKVSFNPFTSKPQLAQTDTPILDNILEDSDAKIKLGLAHDNALKLLNASIEQLTNNLESVSAAKLPAVIAAASKTVESIRRERAEATKNGKDKEVHFHFYTPQQNKLTDYEVIDVA